jgi:hypothetical protein
VKDHPPFCPELCVPIFGLPDTMIVVERSKPVRITLLRDSNPVVVVVEQGLPGALDETGRLLAGLRFQR